MNIKKSTLFMGGILILIILAGIFLLQNKDNTGTGSVSQSNSNENTQKVVLGIKDYNYYPNTITLNAGQPVSISLDSTVSGCLRDFTIRAMGIHKYLKSPQDTIEFTPTKPGTYTFACSMGMGTGTLIVK